MNLDFLKKAAKALEVMHDVQEVLHPSTSGKEKMDLVVKQYKEFIPQNKISPEELQDLLQKGYDFAKAFETALQDDL